MKILIVIYDRKFLERWIFDIDFFPQHMKMVTTYCMCSFDHNFCSKVVTSTYEPILEGWYGEEYWKMVYSPQSRYGISQGAWELDFLCFFWIFTSSRPRKWGVFFSVHFIVDFLLKCYMSPIYKRLIWPFWVSRCENIDTYIT